MNDPTPNDPLADAMRREWRARHNPHYDHEERDAKSILDHLADALRDGSLAGVLSELPPEALGFEEIRGSHAAVDAWGDGNAFRRVVRSDNQGEQP